MSWAAGQVLAEHGHLTGGWDPCESSYPGGEGGREREREREREIKFCKSDTVSAERSLLRNGVQYQTTVAHDCRSVATLSYGMYEVESCMGSGSMLYRPSTADQCHLNLTIALPSCKSMKY